MTVWSIDIVEVGVIPDIPYNAFVPSAAPELLFDVPCFSYLLTTPGRCVLVDSGPDRVSAAKAGFTVSGDARSALLDGLRRRGRTPGDVHTLLHTHLHYDHMQNDRLFPGASIVVHERETPWARSEQDRFYVDIDAYLNDASGRLQLVGAEQELEDGIRLLPNGGHTPGHQSVLVSTAEGPVCLCADIIPLGANLTTLPACMDPDATRAFVERVQHERWTAIPGHDPAVRADTRYVAPR